MVLNNLPIKAKVVAGFVPVIAVVALLGLTAIQKSSELNQTVQQTAAEDLASVGYLSEMREAFQTYRTALLADITFAGNAGAAADVAHDDDRAMADSLLSLKQSETRYEATISGSDENAAYQEYIVSRDRFMASATAVLDLLHQHQAAEAGLRYRAQMQPLAATVDAALKHDLDLNFHSVTQSAATAKHLYNEGRLIVLGLLIACLGLAAIMITLSVRSIAMPVKAMTQAMRELAARNMQVVIPAQNRRDEVGAMAGAVQVFKDAMIEADRLAGEQHADRSVKEKRAQHLADLVRQFEGAVGNMVGQLASASTELNATAHSMSAIATQTCQQAEAVAGSAQEASAGTQTAAAAAEELSASIAEITRQVAQSSLITSQAVQSTKRTDEIVRALADGAQKIGDVVSLITSIAGQTNLLALNATIEAARAGDAGKGFAVVASEVKSLANQTSKATEEIAGQIGSIQTATHEAVDAIRDITQRIEEVSTIAAAIASAVKQQGDATAEIARNVQQSSDSTQDVTVSIATVSQTASETGSAATQVLAAASELSRQAEQLSAEVNGFVTGVRNAA